MDEYAVLQGFEHCQATFAVAPAMDSGRGVRVTFARRRQNPFDQTFCAI